MKDLLRSLAIPRLVGSDGAKQTHDLVRDRLTGLGYEVENYTFTFSTLPGRFAVSVAGALFMIGSLGTAALLHMRHPGIALVILLLTLLLSGGIAVLAAPLTNMLPWGRVPGCNMFATKAGSKARYIFMAHIDTKSQPIPLAFRGPAIILAMLTWVAFVLYAVLSLLDPVYLVPEITTVLGVLSLLAGVLLIFCWVDNRSPGALDNASGLATVLGLAESEKDRDDVAFLITDAEELGLVGARYMAGKLDPVFGVINIDGIDDDGTFYVLERFGVPARYIAPHLVASILTAADTLQLPAQRRNVPFGLMLDHIPLAKANLPSITLMRGSFRSLRRVHRPADSMDHMTGSGIETAVRLLRDALEQMREANRHLVGNRPAR